MKYILVMLFLTFTTSAFGNDTCTELFSDAQVEKFIRELAELRLQLDLSQTSNDTTLVLTALGEEFKKRENYLVHYLEKKGITYPELRKKIKDQISLIQNQKENPDEIKNRKHQETEFEKILNPGKKGIFYSVNSETHTFELMSTKTTQIIYQKVANLINEGLGGVRHPWWWLRRSIKTEPMELYGDLLPMHSVSYEEVQHWFEGLNELSRRKYPELKEIFDGHEDGDIYYLPRKFEIDMVSNHANFKNYVLDDIAWTAGNSRRHLYPVAQKEPVTINTRPFYDLLGNGKEWIDQKAAIEGDAIFWGLPIEGETLTGRYSVSQDWYGTSVSFRVARKVRKK